MRRSCLSASSSPTRWNRSPSWYRLRRAASEPKFERRSVDPSSSPTDRCGWFNPIILPATAQSRVSSNSWLHSSSLATRPLVSVSQMSSCVPSVRHHHNATDTRCHSTKQPRRLLEGQSYGQQLQDSLPRRFGPHDVLEAAAHLVVYQRARSSVSDDLRRWPKATAIAAEE